MTCTRILGTAAIFLCLPLEALAYPCLNEQLSPNCHRSWPPTPRGLPFSTPALPAKSDNMQAELVGTVPGGDPYCSGKAEGTYPHPKKCTHYIFCDNNGLAFEMPCPDCNKNFPTPACMVNWSMTV